MNERGGPPGGGESTIVARGKIKVDARKAIAKLRDHMLVDAHLYGPEIARVAVGCGATMLDIDYDTDDVVFTFDGRPLDAAQIARARDHVLTPTMEGDGLALHALGIGVSAALGLDPSFVDVYVGNGPSCSRVRFEPKHIAEGEEELAPAVEVLEKPARSAGLEGPWMRVHVRRRMGLDLVGRALTGKRPREIGATIERTRDAPLAICVKGDAVVRAPETVVLSVDLDEPAATRAVLEIVAPSGEPRALTEILERGVRIASYPAIGAWPEGEESLPARVVIDLPKVPTNASRSEVRFDADIVKRIRSRIPQAFTSALEALEAIVVRGATPSSVCTSTMKILPRKELLEDALGAIVAEVAIGRRRHRKLPEEAMHLLGLPLLRDAVGGPLALDALAGGSAEKPIFVLVAPKPASEALAPWLGQMVWRRGRAVERALLELHTADGTLALALAAEGYQRRKRALEHPPSPPVLASSAAYLFKEKFEVKDGPFRGLAGEIALARRDGIVQRSGVAHLYVESRVLESIPLSALSLPIDMALEWPGLIRAKFAYDGVEKDEAVTRATLYALRLAAIAVGEHLGKDPELTRLAIVAWMGATKELKDTPVAAQYLGRLADAPAWKTTTGAFVSFTAIEEYAKRKRAVCIGTAGKGAAPDDRPVIVTGHSDLLRPFLDENVKLVPYDRALGLGPDASTAVMEVELVDSPVKMPFSRPSHRGFIGLGPARFRAYHAGARLVDRDHYPRIGPVTVVVDDPSAVPAPDWSSALSSTPIDLAREEEAFLDLVLDQCEAGTLPYEVVKAYLTVGTGKVNERATTSKGAFKERYAKTAQRMTELPQKLAQARSERLRQQVLARPKEDPLAGIIGPRATVAHRDGEVTVALDPVVVEGSAPKRNAAITYSGRIVGYEGIVDLPLAVSIEIHRDSLLVDWSELSFEGKKWAKDVIDDAAKKLATELAKSPSFTNELPAMQLALALVEGSPLVSYAMSNAITRAAWPTVQGGSMTISVIQSKVPFGKLAYANETYRLESPASPYDAPTVHIPENRIGAIRHALLVAAGCELEDVTEPIGRLQVRRARGARSAPPRLAGAPADPRLRATLESLRSTHLEGELELIADGASEIVRVDEQGIATALSIGVGIPMRAVFRGEPMTDAQLVSELGQAAERLLRGLVAQVDALPSWVRDRLRLLVCVAIRKGMRSGPDASLKVFVDVKGEWHALRDLVAKGRVGATADPPPYPSNYETDVPILRLDLDQTGALTTVVSVVDMRATLRAELQGEIRRNAPPLETVALAPAVRGACIGTFSFERDGIRGEIGILAPAHVSLRGIAVHTTKRPVTTIPDSTAAWPMVAVLDVDDLPVTPAFDALAKKSDIDRIQRTVRNEGCANVHGLMPVPQPALAAATMRLPAPFPATNAQCLGVFWIEGTWPEAPTIHLETIDGVDPLRLPRIVNHEAHHGILPIHGKVYIAVAGTAAIEAALDHVLLWVRSRLGTMVGSASRGKRTTQAELDAYTWDLAMVGATKDRDVAAEARRDRPNAVFQRVAARRAPQLLDPTGGRSTPMENVARAAEEHASLVPDVPGPAPIESVFANSDSVVPESFLAGVARKLVSSIRPSAVPPPPASPIASELQRSLLALKLPGDPVAAVTDAKRGRAVRYVKGSRRVELNVQHPAVRALAGRPDAIVYLLMAALSEVNRELESVTDAEESAILLDLLRTLPAAAGR